MYAQVEPTEALQRREIDGIDQLAHFVADGGGVVALQRQMQRLSQSPVRVGGRRMQRTG